MSRLFFSKLASNSFALFILGYPITLTSNHLFINGYVFFQCFAFPVTLMLSNFVLRHGTISCRSLQCHRKVISLTLSTTQTPKLKVALLGRPNTGKSTLFNRLTKSKMAIVSNVPGTTRDRNEGYGNIAGLDLFVIDTGGFDDRGHIHKNVQSQVEQAIRFADVILFLVDAKEGISNLDLNFTKWIRKRMTGGLAVNITSSKASQLDTKHIRLIANKTEGAHLSDRVLDTLAEALQLGLGEPVLISATHGDGMADLAQELIAIAKLKGLDIETPALESAKSNDKIKLEERTIQLAIMGKPNVGKSSFVNAVLKEERVIVGPTPGLTR